ncbi:hypothetical protein CEXT_647211 [Caerostris extrusa]|uniref:Cuticle protein n=1 Tax=Caerostris extrusa TaxID=172846 RepID=A0AAV4QQG9_CAEEX|nr:hypothetical protein CEXT_647211 [Caerostris extrusa]
MLFLVLLSAIALAHASIIQQIVPVPAPQPYKFGYSIRDQNSQQYRQEAGNGAGGVIGNYGFTDDRGIARQVNYVADDAGFRAQVLTNEPGTANQNPAAVQIISNAPYAGDVPVGPAVVVQQPIRPAVVVQQPIRPAVVVQLPIRPAVVVQQPIRPAVVVQQPIRPAVLVQQPAIGLRAGYGHGF